MANLMVTDDLAGKASLSWNDFRVGNEQYILDFSKDNFVSVYATYPCQTWTQRNVTYTPDNVARYARVRTPSATTNVVAFAHVTPPPPPPPDPPPVGVTHRFEILGNGELVIDGKPAIAEATVLAID